MTLPEVTQAETLALFQKEFMVHKNIYDTTK